MYAFNIFSGPKILNPAVRVKTTNLTKPKFPSASFFELTQKKVRRIKMFQRGD